MKLTIVVRTEIAGFADGLFPVFNRFDRATKSWDWHLRNKAGIPRSCIINDHFFIPEFLKNLFSLIS